MPEPVAPVIPEVSRKDFLSTAVDEAVTILESSGIQTALKAFRQKLWTRRDTSNLTVSHANVLSDTVIHQLMSPELVKAWLLKFKA